MSSRLETSFSRKMGSEWRLATQGLVIQAHHRGRKVLDLEFGKTYPVYDWASLTKIVFTTSALMREVDGGVAGINDRISRWVPWFPEGSEWRLRDLLCHSAGMTWWYPFYKKVVERVPRSASPEQAWLIFEDLLRRRVLADMKRQPLKRRAVKAVYSDIDFFLLGVALQAIAGAPLYEIWHEHADKMGLRDTDFHRGNRPSAKRSLFAPTEDCAWRGKVLRGEVHDQNAWSLRGVAPHAGLFGPMDDLSRFGLLLRGAMLGKTSSRFASPETVQVFTRRAIPRARGDWTLGFMMPSESSSCGPLFSRRSVGHTGFTGTSLWFDPERDLLVTVLSNRVHPSVENIEIRKLRPKIHTWIAEEL